MTISAAQCRNRSLVCSLTGGCSAHVNQLRLQQYTTPAIYTSSKLCLIYRVTANAKSAKIQLTRQQYTTPTVYKSSNFAITNCATGNALEIMLVSSYLHLRPACTALPLHTGSLTTETHDITFG